MVELTGVNANLRQRIERMLLLSNDTLWVTSAVRTREEQERLYALYLAGGTLAAKPGTSNHERGLAVDVGCHWDESPLRKRLAKECGLISPVKREPWHMELDPKAQPLPKVSIPTIQEASTMTRTPAVSIMPTLTGEGYWVVATDGGVFAYGDAVFYGGMGGQTLTAPISGAALHPSGRGYWLLGQDGGVFAFGEARFLGTPREHLD